MDIKLKRKIAGGLFMLMLLCMIRFNPVLAAGTADTNKKTVRVSCGMNQALYLDDNGKPAGYLAYYVAQLAYINNWQLEYVEGSWNECIQNLYDGKIDLLFPTQKLEERLDTMAFSEYAGGYQPIALYTKANAELYYDDYSAFNGKKIAVSEKSSNALLLEAYAKEKGFSYSAVNLDSAEDKIAALTDGTVDMIVFSTMNEVPDAKIVGQLDYLPFYFCTRIADTELMNEVNTGMRKILADNPNVAADVYDTVLKGSTPISFTREENETIRATEKIRVGIYDDSLPLSGRDAEGKPIGIYIDLLKAIEEKAGVAVEPVLIPRDEKLYSNMENGTVDFVIGSKGLAYNEEDVSKFMCSESIMDYITVAITRPDFSFEEDKKPVFMITQARKYWESDILEEFPEATVLYCNDVKEGLTAVQRGKADVTLANTWEYNYQSKNARFSNLIEWESLRKRTDLVLGVKKGTDMTLLSIMEKAIDQVAGQDKDNIVASNLNMPYSDYNIADYWYSIRYIVLVAGIMIVLLGIGAYFYWNMRRNHINELERKNEQLEKSNEAKDLFLSRMSHELRTPLNAINGYAAVMDENITNHIYDEKQAHTYMESIMRAVKYQLAIVGDLLEIQKIESGKIEIVSMEIDFDGFMDNIVAMIAPEAGEKNIDFTYERLGKVKDTYLLDGVRFEQVLLNLLHNAVKFTPAGGRVKMTAEVVDQNETANTLKIVISDTGIGMSEDFQQNYLFQRFAQEYQGNTSPYEGCGTGLAISREIMHLMGGEITCESRQGVGSTFTVIITAKHTERKKKKTARMDYSAFDLSGIRILLCEDNKMNQDIERRLLEKMHCIVDVAADGKICTDMFRQSAEHTYDIILMDIRMPNMDGYEATRAIRKMAREDAGTIPILAVSANSFEEDVKKSITAGMQEHLSKPVDVRILYEKISFYCISRLEGQKNDR